MLNNLQVGKEAKLDKFEIPAKIKLLPDQWTPESGLVTAALKLKREQLKAKFKDELQKLYGWSNFMTIFIWAALLYHISWLNSMANLLLTWGGISYLLSFGLVSFFFFFFRLLFRDDVTYLVKTSKCLTSLVLSLL